MYHEFCKNEPEDQIWWVDGVDSAGPLLFSFDKKTIYNFWTDYPDKLTPEQIEIFRRENPTLAALK